MSEDFNYHFGNILYKEIEYLQVRNMKLIEENSQLKDRINKAVEYINDNVAVCAFGNEELPHWEFSDDEIKEILDLLKGDKE